MIPENPNEMSQKFCYKMWRPVTLWYRIEIEEKNERKFSCQVLQIIKGIVYFFYRFRLSFGVLLLDMH